MKLTHDIFFTDIAADTSLFHIHPLSNMCNEIREKNGEPHIHKYFSIYWLNQGEAIHSTSYVDYTLRKDSILFIPPGLEHKFMIDKSTKGYGIIFNENFFALKETKEKSLSNYSLFSSPDFRSIINIDEKQSVKFQLLIEMMINEQASDSEYKNDILLQQLKLFILESRRIYETQHETEPIIDESHPGSVVIKFKQLIDTNFKEHKNVSSYADMLNLRANCLNEISKKTTGITAGELIRNRVVKEAKKMLYASESNTKEIAYELGFQDPAYFSRFFKKYTSQTLSDFRKLIRK